MLFVYNMADKYFLNTCSGQQCFLIANQIAHLTTNKPIKSSRCKKIQRECVFYASEKIVTAVNIDFNQSDYSV